MHYIHRFVKYTKHELLNEIELLNKREIKDIKKYKPDFVLLFFKFNNKVTLLL